jgi:hypothetical protein
LDVLATDPGGLVSGTARLYVQITNVNEPPELQLTSDLVAKISGDYDYEAEVMSLAGIAQDPEGSTLTHEIVQVALRRTLPRPGQSHTLLLSPSLEHILG